MFRSASPSVWFALLCAGGFTSGCFPPDTTSVEGALAAAAQALEAGDVRKLYSVTDERARHALMSIANDRRRSAEWIQAHYPEPERSQALAALGAAARARDAADLVAQRCDRSCMQALAGRIAAPRDTQADGEEWVVNTVRGSQLRLYRGGDGHYGLVWDVPHLTLTRLVAERSEAARDAEQIEKNAAIYARRNALEP